MKPNNRPLSPHLQIYKLPLTGIVSITHRMTGALLAFGLIVYVISFFILLQGQDPWQSVNALFELTIMRLIVWLFIFSLFFHFCHGIRHLIWDIGWGFTKIDMDKLAIIEIVSAFLLTLICY
jgi:succinate dehydrogenase / fumarate reductase cytochrome b subunit